MITRLHFKFIQKKSKYLMVLFLFMISLGLSAQTTISGIVLDDSGETLIGVNVLIKGTVSGTITDFDGNFKVNIGGEGPYVLVFSYTGFESQEMEFSSTQSGVKVELASASILANEVVISASRVEEKILESPVTVEKLDLLAIKAAAAPDFYDALSNLKGVHTTQGSMTLTSINTRGFGAVANTRFVQLIDGMDNSAPLLNFPTGNVVGISELDIRSVEIVPGAASALYGPNAFNGILMMNSKSPFQYQGLSVQMKGGISSSDSFEGSDPMYTLSARYAKAFNDKLAIKINVSYMKATDWRANDYDIGRLSATNSVASVSGAPNFDGLNRYGDEAQIVVPMVALATPLSAALAPLFAPSLGVSEAEAQGILAQAIPGLPTLDIRRTGFKEEDIVDNNDVGSTKISAALHYRLTDNLEASYSFRRGQGSTIYQGGERYVLRDFSLTMHKVELKSSNFFIRAYTSITDDGDSYNLSALGAFANERFSPSSAAWVPTYAGTYAGALLPTVLQGGTISDELLAGAHAAARAAADNGIPKAGTTEFNTVMQQVRDDLFQRSPPGAGFVDESKLYHVEFNYNFRDIIDFADIQVGGNYRLYDLFSDGTVFNEDPTGTGTNQHIKIGEYGFYTQISKKLADDRLKLTGSVRYDKNENFDGQLSPRISAVYSGGEKRQHNFRASYQTGFRNPSTQEQFIYFPTSSGILVGSTETNASRYGFYNGGAYTNSSYNAFIGSLLAGAPNPGLLKEVNIPYIGPEKLQAIEFGYKGLWSNKMFIDFNVYRNIYDGFIAGRTIRIKESTVQQGVTLNGVDDMLAGTATSAQAFRPYTNAEETVTSTGVGLGFRYVLPKGYNLYGNYSYSVYNVEDAADDFEAGFNMPKNKFLIGFSNRNLVKSLGFDINYRWQDEFFWENTFAYGTIDAFGVLNAQVNYTFKELKTVLKIGGTNLLSTNYRTNAGGPFIGRIVYVSLTFDQFLN